MRKASKWFRGLFGLKRSDPSPNPGQKPPTKKKWSFAKSHVEKDRRKSQHGGGAAPAGHNDNEASRHAIAVAEAAVRAAHAAAAVVKLTGSAGNTSTARSGGGLSSAARVSQNGRGYRNREEWAAVTIQSHFRAYLARRALRALKALVKIQALVRGNILRKQAADDLRRMQALVRAQARARAGRVLVSETPYSTTKSSHFKYTAPATQEKLEQRTRASSKHEQLMMLKRNGSKSNVNLIYNPENSWEQGSFTRIIHIDDATSSDKILEVDTAKPHIITPKKFKYISHSSNLSHHSSDQYTTQSLSASNHSTAHHPKLPISPSSGEVQSLRHLKYSAQDGDNSSFQTAENSPLFYSASSTGCESSKRAPFTPTKSDGSRSCLHGYSDHPNYMSYTKSSKAKVRSLSTPRQRVQYERSSSMSRYSVHGYGESRTNNNSNQKVSAMHLNFANKAYPGSGRLDRLGMPVVRGDVSGFSGGHWHGY